MNMKRFMTARRMSRQEITTRLRQLNGSEVGEITKAQAWDIAEELFACGCSIRWSEDGYTAQGLAAPLGHHEELTSWNAV